MTALPTLMDFADAANRQYLYSSYYTVWIVSPAGERTYLGYTPRKTGTGLMLVLQREEVYGAIFGIMGTSEVTYKKSAAAVTFNNGWRVTFGGTIRDEASAVKYGA